MYSKIRKKNGNKNEQDCEVTKDENDEFGNMTNMVINENKTVTKKCKKLLKKISKKEQKWKSESCDSPVIEKNEENITFVIGSVSDTPQNVEKITHFLLKKKGNQKKNQLKKNDINCNNMQEDNFFCEECNYKTKRKANWLRHIKTAKHYKKLGLMCQMCGRKYETKSGLWKHQQRPCKKYKRIKKPKENAEVNNSSMFAKIVAQALGPAITQLAEVQKERQDKVERKYDEMINQIIPRIGNNNTTNNTVNNH